MYVVCISMGLLSLLLELLTTYYLQVAIVLTFAAAALFGWLYDTKVVDRIEREWVDHGYAAFMVVGGVLVILLLSIPVVGLLNAVYMFGLFAASGTFMVWGSMRRINSRRKVGHETLKEQLEALVAGFELPEGGEDDAA